MRPDAGFPHLFPGGPKATLKRHRGALLVALVLAALFALDMAYFKLGTYRAPMADSSAYFDRGQLLMAALGKEMPWLGRISGSPLFTRDWPDWVSVSKFVETSVSQGGGYPVLLGVAQVVFGENYQGARIANALLHVATGLVLLLIGRRLGGAVTGAVALGLFAGYLPFTYMASQLLSENLCHFLLVLAAWLVLRLTGTPTRRDVLLAAPLLGLALIWLALARPAYWLLSLAFLAAAGGALLWCWRSDRQPRRLAALALVLGAYLLPYAAWQAAVMAHYPDQGLLLSTAGPRSVSTSLHESYDLFNDGFPRPLVITQVSGVNPFAPPALQSVREAPFRSALLRVEKFYRLWKSPSIIYSNPIPGTAAFTGLMHVALAGLALVGVMCLRPGIPLLFLLLPVVYTAVIYTGYFSEERRFVFPVMTFVILLAAMAVVRVGGILRERPGASGRAEWRRWRIPAAWGALALGSGLWATAGGFTVHPALSPAVLHETGVVLFSVALLAGAVWLAWRLEPRRRMLLAGLWIALVVLPVTVHLAAFTPWHGFSQPLERPGDRVRQRIVPPAGLDLTTARSVTLQIDLRDPDGMLDNLDVRLNGRRLGGFIPLRKLPYAFRHVAGAMGPLVSQEVIQRTDVVPEMAQWLTVPLNPRALAADVFQVSVGLADGAAAGDRVTVFGDVAYGDPALGRGPRPWLPRAREGAPRTAVVFSGRNSYWRYQTYGDMRLYGNIPLSARRESALLKDAGPPPPDGDLSDAPFLQRGTYRIFLHVIDRDGREWVL